jgi:hypothetical protein
MEKVDLGIEGVKAYRKTDQGSPWLVVEAQYPSPKSGGAWHFEPYKTLRLKVDDWQRTNRGVSVRYSFPNPAR